LEGFRIGVPEELMLRETAPQVTSTLLSVWPSMDPML
jgi:hypothetical protein